MLEYKKSILLQCRRYQRGGKQGYSPDGLERCSHIAEVIGSSPIIPTHPKKVQENKFLFFLNLFYFFQLPGCLFLSTSFDECRSAEHDESRPYHSHFTILFRSSNAENVLQLDALFLSFALVIHSVKRSNHISIFGFAIDIR